ncbi:MAG: D-alanyl-D-alanine carboxypeptidase [Ruminococcaceae bacterium]|nr:D-alanyl-D-alanine carboxypeptidase [Oscillospiraceae bacterium]
MLIRKTISILISLLLIILNFNLVAEASTFSVSAKSAILINADTLEVLYNKAEHEKRGIASTTKILTSLIALEYGVPQKEITATKEAVTVEGTSIGLKAGDKITLMSLVYGMLLESGNDAANVTAFAISGNITEFAKVMNAFAKKIGMTNSNFTNPSGLTDKNHYSTAFDMALLTSVAIKNPIFRKIASTESAVIDFGVPEISRSLTNHNRLLRGYDGVFGVKTGYTKASGRCLVTACEKNGVTLIAVTLNAYDDWNDHKKLYDYGFSLYDKKVDVPEIKNLKIPVVCSDKKTVSVDFAYEVEFNTNKDLKSEIFIKNYLYPPVKKGDIVGEIVYKDTENNAIKIIPLVSVDNANALYKENEKENDILGKIKKFIKGLSIRYG